MKHTVSLFPSQSFYIFPFLFMHSVGSLDLSGMRLRADRLLSTSLTLFYSFKSQAEVWEELSWSFSYTSLIKIFSQPVFFWKFQDAWYSNCPNCTIFFFMSAQVPFAKRVLYYPGMEYSLLGVWVQNTVTLCSLLVTRFKYLPYKNSVFLSFFHRFSNIWYAFL